MRLCWPSAGAVSIDSDTRKRVLCYGDASAECGIKPFLLRKQDSHAGLINKCQYGVLVVFDGVVRVRGSDVPVALINRYAQQVAGGVEVGDDLVVVIDIVLGVGPATGTSHLRTSAKRGGPARRMNIEY